MTELRRATSVAEFVGKMEYFISPEGFARAEAFNARSDDIIVSTYAKAGTTWMQQIVHGLRTNGDMDFGEICDVVPWIELAHDVGWDIVGEQKASPRAFKTHYEYEGVPKGARYIWVVRDPKDTAVSFYNFMNGWFLERDVVSIDDFVQDFFLERPAPRGYWNHLIGWYNAKEKARETDDVLALTFEDMKDDLSGAVKRVAGFMGCDDESAIEIATHQAHFSFMKEHERQFDDHPLAQARCAALRLPEGAGSSKVKSGNVGGHKNTLSDETAQMLDAKWAEVVEPQLGFADYAALRKALAHD